MSVLIELGYKFIRELLSDYFIRPSDTRWAMLNIVTIRTDQMHLTALQKRQGFSFGPKIRKEACIRLHKNTGFIQFIPRGIILHRKIPFYVRQYQLYAS